MIFMYILDRFQNCSKCFKKRLFDPCLPLGGVIDFHVQNLLMHFNEANCRLELCGLNLERHLVLVGPFSIAM